MRAALYVGQDEPLAIENVKPTDPGATDVVVHIAASGVCHSDLSVIHGYLPGQPGLILGHEGAGTVEWVGSRVTRAKPGDRVIASWVPACDNCWTCLHSRSHLCTRAGKTNDVVRATRTDGGICRTMGGLGTFAEQMTVDESAIVPITTDLPDEQLALIGCGVTTGVGAVLNTARVKPGSTVAVIGCGGVGQSVIQGAVIAGAARILAIDPIYGKRIAASRAGATDLIDPTQGDPVELVKDATDGPGADYTFEVVGRADLMLQAWRMARRGGVVVFVGMPPATETITFPASRMLTDAKEIRGSMYGSAQVRRDFPRLVALAESGRLDIAAMVSRKIRLDEVNDAFQAMEAGEVIRSVIV